MPLLQVSAAAVVPESGSFYGSVLTPIPGIDGKSSPYR